MPLQLNLFHEEILQERQRQRDPLKLSMYAAIGIAALLLLNYLWTAARVLNLKSHVAAAQHEWQKIEPKVSAAHKRADELNQIIGTTKALDGYIDTRFYWAPMLEKVARCVTPNVQITSLDGTAGPEQGVSVTLNGMAGGREPRGVAEDFRQMLLEQVGKSHPGLKVEFKTLEDLETLVPIDGNNMPTAHFVVVISFNPWPKAATNPAQDRKTRRKKEED